MLYSAQHFDTAGNTLLLSWLSACGWWALGAALHQFARRGSCHHLCLAYGMSSHTSAIRPLRAVVIAPAMALTCSVDAHP